MSRSTICSVTELLAFPPRPSETVAVAIALPGETGAVHVGLAIDALVSDPAKAADQAVRMVMEQKVKTITGKTIDAKIDTICIHGDSPGADKIVAAVREGLVKAGATVKPLRDWFKG